jgi:outer membrane protein assembly factor BamB
MRRDIFAVVVAVLVVSGWCLAGDWPCWRGPEGTGHVPEGVAVPKTLPAEPAVIWHVPVGNGLASPIVSAGKVVYLDHQQGKEVVHAADAATGKEVWSVPLDEVFKDAQSVPGPRCTPSADGQRVYVQSCRGEFQCLSLADGKQVWRTHFVKDFGAKFFGETGPAAGASRHGYTGSPLIDGDRLLVGVGGAKGASVVCFDKATGKVLWQSQDDVPGYSGPVIAIIGGALQVVSFTAVAVIGLDAADGKLLWRFPVRTSLGRHAMTPLAVGDVVVVSSHEAGLLGVRVSKDGEAWQAKQAWVSKPLAVNFASCVAAGNFLYGLGPAKTLFCLDAQTGQKAWAKENFYSDSGAKIYASFLVMGQNILMLAESGELFLLPADPKELRTISTAKACGRNWCNPAYADGKLFLRDEKELRCLQLLP